MRRATALREAIRDTGITRWAYARSVLAGSAALGSAVGLAAVAAWLIGRAAQLPNPADLALAAVAVRFFGIGRGVFRYVERLTSHDTALRGVVHLRERTYIALASASARTVLSLRRGDIVARAGADLDAVGDAVVRCLIPAGVAVVVSALATVIVGSQLLIAGFALAVILALAGIVPASLTSRAARIAADAGVVAAAEVSAASLTAVEASAEHRVWDEDGSALAAVAGANRATEDAADAAAASRRARRGRTDFLQRTWSHRRYCVRRDRRAKRPHLRPSGRGGCAYPARRIRGRWRHTSGDHAVPSLERCRRAPLPNE